MIWLGTRGAFCVTSGIWPEPLYDPGPQEGEHLTQQSQHLPKIPEHTWLQVWESRNRVDKEAKAVVESGIWAERREEDLLPNRQRRN